MEILSLIYATIGISLLIWLTKFLIWSWWKPWRLDRALRAQGLKGTTYKFLLGDLNEITKMNKEARSKPMSLNSHNYIPCVAPFLLHAMNKNGKDSFTWYGHIPRVTLTDPVLIREVFSNKFGCYYKPKANTVGLMLATGLISYEGEKWAKHRRIINPVFHLEKLKQMFPAFSTCCCELISRWETLIGSKGECEIDVHPELQIFTGDVISRTAFGSNFEEGRRIYQLQTEQAELIVRSAMYFQIPGYRFLPNQKNKRLKVIDKEIKSLLRGIIENREKAMRNDDAKNDDLLGALLESNSDKGGKSQKFRMSTEEVIEECKLFYFGGGATTSALMTWAMILLSMHPSWQSRAREEVREVLGEKKPDVDCLNRLKIVTMILNETLRLYPSAIFPTRRTSRTVKLGDITYPEGVDLRLPIPIIHRDTEYWGENAHEFNPERFAQGISKASKGQPAFFPFGWGPRICIGQNFAIIEAKVGLSMILQHFEFELSPSYAHAPYSVLTLQPQHGTPLVLRKI